MGHKPMVAAGVVLSACVVMLSGCSSAFVPVASEGAAQLSGEVFGGQSPIVGANVYAFSSGTGAYGAASTSLIAGDAGISGDTPTAGTYGNYVATDSDGYFQIEASTPCTVGSVTYLYSVGGNAGVGTNTAAGEMAALGVCTDGLLVDSVSSAHIHLNEVATVAAAYALAGFATDATHISAPSATDTLAATGIHNAINNAAQLYSVVPNSTSDAGSIANATTPNGNGTVPQALIDTLANSLAGCVNATAAATQCTTLLGDAKSAGATGTTPTDTATAAIYIAHNPLANVTAIFNNGTTTPQFSPALGTAPNDFTVEIQFTGGGLVGNNSANGVSFSPHTMAVDAAGNIWTTNPNATALSEFNSLGVPLSGATGFGTLSTPYSVSVDTSGNAWVTNMGNSTIAEFTSAGGTATGSPFSTGLTLSGPTDGQFDASGHLWVCNETSGALDKLTPGAGTLTQAATASHTSTYLDPLGLAIQSGATGLVFGGMLATAGTTGYINVFTAADAYSIDNTKYTTGNFTNGVAVDSSNFLWVTQEEAYVWHGASTAGTGTPTKITVGAGAYYEPFPWTVTLDGAGNAWVPDFENGTIYEITSANAIISGTYGFPLGGNTISKSGTVPTLVENPTGLAIDGSGDVWTVGVTAVLREKIGLATPVATPLAYATANAKLAQKP